ncbi:hypothetical protein Celal_0294 [Cellulophaga algicola DSM 14237]|uniref:Uncharacterized protein n=1 Tax=Cellulophaga algicola (strain DSM 14237 / IC166 / ACAM 630) TaxID=688270 RepID=E6X9A0_CELAD|nr:hypothetical protein Celal_0294 [Cellulophaga algicola DSM 14237]
MVKLSLTASKLSAVNLAIERTARKAFKSEILPTYDLYPIMEKNLRISRRVLTRILVVELRNLNTLF